MNHLIVQENLFHGHSVSRMCDLKGAQRNRGGEDEGDTVLDENLFRFNDGYPLLLSESAKQQLTRALWNDTLFLSSINVMDYSLLVGFELRGAERREGEGEWTLVVGLIDYCRQFTWKEEAESRVKRATVIHPRLYKRRLLAASARPSRQPLAHNNPPLTAKRANSCGSPSLLHDRFQRLRRGGRLGGVSERIFIPSGHVGIPSIAFELPTSLSLELLAANPIRPRNSTKNDGGAGGKALRRPDPQDS